MSARFGRNKRRRAREEFAALALKASREASGRAMAEALCKDMQRKLEEARDYQMRVARIVGDSAIVAGVPNKLKSKGFDRIRMVPHQEMPAFFDGAREPLSSMGSVNFEVLRLLNVQAIKDEMRQMMHVRVDLADGRVGYSISEHALANLGAMDLAELIGPEIIRTLALELAGGRK